eukprot:6186804-Pleurochrysis_carterae.AAC.2
MRKHTTLARDQHRHRIKLSATFSALKRDEHIGRTDLSFDHIYLCAFAERGGAAQGFSGV